MLTQLRQILVSTSIAVYLPLERRASQGCSSAPAITKWAALGDLYAAGPGAGERIPDTPVDCGNYDHAYPLAMAADQCMPKGYGSQPQLLACSKDTLSDISNQVGQIEGSPDLATLSAGINTVGIIKVLDACVFKFGGSSSTSCSLAISNAENFMTSPSFSSSWGTLLSNLESKLSQSVWGKVYVTGYGTFFDDTTDECDSASYGVFSGSQPPLTKELRTSLNEVMERLNWWLHYSVTQYNRKQGSDGSRQGNKAEYADYDECFNGHRFCSASSDSWFFNGGDDTSTSNAASYGSINTNTCAQQTALTGNWGDYIQCQIAVGLEDDASQLSSFGSKTAPSTWANIFHPTTTGHSTIKDEVLYEFFEAPTVTGLDLRILPLGDSITAGYLSTSGTGYRPILLNTLTSNKNTVQYVGSQGNGTLKNEGRYGYTLSELIDVVTAPNASTHQRPNVVLLHAGTNDMIRPFEPETAYQRLSTLIDDVLHVATDAVVIVAQIIPPADADSFANMVRYNSECANMINQKQVAGQKVLKAWMPLTTEDLQDGIHPTDKGYALMSQGWIRGLERAVDKKWITPPVSVQNSPGTTGGIPTTMAQGTLSGTLAARPTGAAATLTRFPTGSPYTP